MLKTLLCFSFLVLLQTGCAFHAQPVWQDPSLQRQWPPSPDPARIRLLRTISGPDDLQINDRKSGVLRWLTGESELKLKLVSPYGITADGEGRIWVADMGIHGVHVIDLGRKKIDYIFSAGEQPLISPVGVASDPARNRLYLSDSALAKIYVYDLKGRYLAEWSPPDGFGRPAGLAVAGDGRLFVADATKNRVTVFLPDGKFERQIESGSPPEQRFHTPSNVVVNRDGQLFVTDSMNFRVEVFDPAGRSLKTIGSIGDGPGYFGRPRGIALDSSGHLYVADASFDNIQVFDMAGQLLIYFGQAGKNPGDLSLPAGLFIDRNDRIYVSDPYNGRIQLFEYVPQTEPPSR